MCFGVREEAWEYPQFFAPKIFFFDGRTYELDARSWTESSLTDCRPRKGFLSIMCEDHCSYCPVSIGVINGRRLAPKPAGMGIEKLAQGGRKKSPKVF